MQQIPEKRRFECDNCGKSVVEDRRAGAQKLCCSDECSRQRRDRLTRLRNKERRAKEREKLRSEKKTCEHCGAEYLRRDGTPRYCSVKCRVAAGSRRGNAKRRATIRATEYVASAGLPELIERDGTNCMLCGSALNLDLRGSYHDDAPEVDHIIPLSRGGFHAPYNLQVAHRKCNRKKGNGVSDADRQRARELWPGWDGVVTLAATDKRKSRTAKSSLRGVFFRSDLGRWVASAERDGKRLRRVFDTMDQAVEARERFIEELYADKAKNEGDQGRRRGLGQTAEAGLAFANGVF